MPPPGRHGVGEVVDVEGASAEGEDADEGVAEDFEFGGEDGGGLDVLEDFLGGADDLGAGVEVAGFADADETGPAGGG